MSGHIKEFLILFIVVGLVSCSRPKTISRDDLHSHFLAAISLASETDLFIGQVQQGRVTRAFAKGHFGYLSKEAMRSADELRQSNVEDRLVSALDNCRTQLGLLAELLANLKEADPNQETLSIASQEAARIKMTLEHAKDRL